MYNISWGTSVTRNSNKFELDLVSIIIVILWNIMLIVGIIFNIHKDLSFNYLYIPIPIIIFSFILSYLFFIRRKRSN